MTTHALPAPRHTWLSLLGWLVLAHLAGLVGGIASVDAPAFYGALAKPSWAPPAGVFGPVWMVLYTLMGIAAWLVWTQRGDLATHGAVRMALRLFVVQLAVNALWSWLFFAWHLGALSSLWLLMLLALIVATIVSFWRVRPLAGMLLLPYLAWVLFATALNIMLWRANPGLL